MRLSINIRLRLLAFFFFLGGALILTSCSDDDIGYDVGINEVKEVTVSLNISAGGVGDISVTRADYEDENALDGEYMNSLCVFVVEDESNTIVARFEPTLNDKWAGDSAEWTLDDALTLTTGSSYIVYAFSNWETVTDDPNDNSEWSDIIAKEANGYTTLTTNELNIDIDDPASLVNIADGKYIPMSGSATITVTEDNTTLQVAMDRLVGRVEITIDGETDSDAQDVTVTSLSFGNYADKVQLMKGTSISTSYTYDKEYSNTSIEQTIAANTTDNQLAVFYVNETSKTSGFDITLTTTRNGVERLYTATTSTIEIPRNYIFPIHLTFSTFYTLDLTVSAYSGPIGAAEREYSNIEIDNEDAYTVTLATVTTWFTMTPSLKDSEGNAVNDDITWTWTQTSENGQLSTDEETTTETLTASGLTATNGHEYSFDLTAIWTSSSVEYERTFQINIVLENYQPSYKSPAHSSWQGWYWNKEQLNMYRIH